MELSEPPVPNQEMKNSQGLLFPNFSQISNSNIKPQQLQNLPES